MHRRLFLLTPLTLTGGTAMARTDPVRSLDDALRWLDQIERVPAVRTTGAWPLSAILDHLAQSIEMSLDGYPQPRSALFQDTAGAAAFRLFKWRGRMRHGLDEAIPGAPALRAGADWKPGALRLRQAVVRFHQHGGALRPHFAYGELSKADYALAHTLYIANHQDEIVAG